MTQKDDEIWGILGRYFNHSMSEADKIWLDKWLQESEENHKYLKLMEELRASEGDEADGRFFEKRIVDEGWASVASHIREKKSAKKQTTIHNLMHRRKKRHMFSSLRNVAAILLIASVSVYVTLQFAYNPQPEEEIPAVAVLQEVATDRGERVNITLGDGTTVSLNVDSKLLTPAQFDGSQRRVVLTGEAFFDVTADPDRPFIIEAGGSVTEVLGTSFGIRSYENDAEVQVIVKSGTVTLRKLNDENKGMEFDSMPGQKVLLRAGEIGFFGKDDFRITSGVADNPDNYFGWMQNRLIFREAPLEEIVETLERWFDVTIRSELSSQEMSESQVTLNVRRGHIRDVLDLISISLNIQYELLGDDHIVIK